MAVGLVQVTMTTMSKGVLLRADAVFAPIRKNSVQCVITSPPYLGQRVYGDSKLELGLEDSVSNYVYMMRWVFRNLKPTLTDTATVWLNLGDKANGSGGAGGDYNAGGSKEGKPAYGKFYDPRFEKGQFLDVPGKVVTGLQYDGWRLRSEIIWNKGQESRESLAHVNRPRVSHEKIFMLTPGPGRCKFYPDRLKETGSIWSFPPAQAERKGHAAPFPDELPSRCVLVSTDPGDVVLDPFAGSGTTIRVAADLDRCAVGLDIYAGSAP
jgi:site-specific DNA-methyltransferase (cytosine-N4-specific)